MNDPDYDPLDDLPAALGGAIRATSAGDAPPGTSAAMIDPRTADVYEVLDELSDMIEMARAVPMSDRCVISRNVALDMLDTIRGMLPRAVQEAEELLADRVGVVEDAYREAEGLLAQARTQSEQILLEARAEQARLVDAHEVTRSAVVQAEAIQAQSWAQAEALRTDVEAETERMRRETDEYIDSKFAAFETMLTKTLNTVARGRERLGERATRPNLRHN